MQTQVYSYPSLLVQRNNVIEDQRASFYYNMFYPSTTTSGHRMSSISASKHNVPPSVFGTPIQLEEQEEQGCRLARIMGFNTKNTDIPPVVPRAPMPPQLSDASCHARPLVDQWPPSPFLPRRIDGKIAKGAYIPVLAKSAVACPPKPETKAAFLDIHSPTPIRSFQTAEFMLNECVSTGEEGHLNAFLPKSGASFDFPEDASQAIHYVPQSPFLIRQPPPTPSTPSLSFPPWPSFTLSLAMPSLDIYPAIPSSLDLALNSSDHHKRLFEYLFLTVPRPFAPSTKKDEQKCRFDPFNDEETNIPSSPSNIPRRKEWCATPESIDLCTFSSSASPCSDDSFYSISSGSGSDMYSDSLCPSPSYSTPATSTRCSSAQSLDQSAKEDEELFREAVHISSIVLSLDERKEDMGEAEWKVEIGRVLEMWKGMYAKKGASEKLLDLGGHEVPCSRAGDAELEGAEARLG